MAGVYRLLFGLVAACVVFGCHKGSGEAVVLEKEYIAAREVIETPAAEVTPTPSEQSGVTPTEEEPRPMAPDEITVGQLVMKAADRGTPRDPRALKDEQWLITVRVVDGGRTFYVHANQAQYEQLKPGDLVKLKYGVGKYTGTVWSADIVELPRR